MKKVLVITYYWPPSGGAGVQRWLKFVKYLREFNWEPIVYTAENGEMPSVDISFIKDIPQGVEVLKQPVWEPYHLYKKFTGRKKEDKINSGFLAENKKNRFLEKVSIWIRGNFFIPDARMFWIKPSVNYLVQYLKSNHIDAVVSTGPPHSMHLIALGIKKKLNIPWLVDFRDPWTQIDFYDKLMLTSFSDKKHKKLEKEVLVSADKVLTVSDNWAKDLEVLGGRKVEVITNGFDEEDFNFPDPVLDEKFSLSHIGSLNKDRNPVQLWQAIKELCEEVPEFAKDLSLKFVGKTDFSVFESLKEKGLMGVTEKINYLPHQEVVKFAASSQVLLLLLNNTPNVMGIIPGKIFEYIASKRPVLCVGPVNGDSAKIIMNTGAGMVSGFEDKEKIKKSIKDLYMQYKNKQLIISSTTFEKFSRKNLTKELSTLLNDMIKK